MFPMRPSGLDGTYNPACLENRRAKNRQGRFLESDIFHRVSEFDERLS